MNRRLHGVVRGVAAVAAACLLVGVPVAIVHDRSVVKADLECRGRKWNELREARRQRNREAIARACTPELISALSSRPPKSPQEAACDALYYPPTTDAEDAALTSGCNLQKRSLPNGGFMLYSTRAWRSCAAATPALKVCSRDDWPFLLGIALLVLAVTMKPPRAA
jgi:hypothetical protein